MGRANNKTVNSNPTLDFEIFGFDEDGKDINIPLSAIAGLINSETLEDFGIYSYQLPFVGTDVSEVVEKKYYTDEVEEATALAGFSKTYTNVAKAAFIVKGSVKEPYDIMDGLGNIITSAFDYYYIQNVSYYVTKENIAPSTIYYKFLKK